MVDAFILFMTLYSVFASFCVWQERTIMKFTFTVLSKWPHPKTATCPQKSWIYNLCRCFFVHYYLIIILSAWRPEAEQINKEIKHLNYIPNKTTPYRMNLWSMKFIILVNWWLPGLYKYAFSLCFTYAELEKIIFENMLNYW